MDNEQNVPDAGEVVQAATPDPAPPELVEQPTPEPAQPVDLAAAAGEVAAKQPRSLDDLGLEEETRTKLEAYVSRQINDARETWESRKQKEIEDGQYMTRDEVQGLLTNQQQEAVARDQAKDSFVRNLGKLGIQVGSEEYDKVADYYGQAQERGMLNPSILSDPAGLEMLVKLSGALPEGVADQIQPSQGLPKTHPSGLQHSDGSIQLGAVLSEGQEMPSQMRIEKAMIEAMRDSS